MRRLTLALVLILMLTSVMFVLGQNEPVPPLQITVDNETCRMALAENAALPDFPAATAETATGAEALATVEAQATAEPMPTYPVLTLGDGCTYLTSLLHVPSNGTLWITLSIPNEFPWQQFQTVPDDPNPPQLDKRGRFVGCANPEQGEQTCYLLWSYLSATYLIEIPLTVRSAYIAPLVTNTPQFSTPVPPPENSGVWGDCGSCTTCGGPVEHCVLAPDNTCVWDAERCEPKGTARRSRRRSRPARNRHGRSLDRIVQLMRVLAKLDVGRGTACETCPYGAHFRSEANL